MNKQQTIKAYKLCTKRKSGTLGPLFINRPQVFTFNEWMPAEAFRVKGFAYRPGWHCSYKPYAPHLSTKDRTWIEVLVRDFREFQRPEAQGGMWLLSNQMLIKRILSFEEVERILEGSSNQNRELLGE